MTPLGFEDSGGDYGGPFVPSKTPASSEPEAQPSPGGGSGSLGAALAAELERGEWDAVDEDGRPLIYASRVVAALAGWWHAALKRAERVEAELAVLREFWEARWAVEVGVNDFDLQNAAVDRLERADAAVRDLLGLPAALASPPGDEA